MSQKICYAAQRLQAQHNSDAPTRPITIPRRLRESLAIKAGDTLTAFQVGNALLLAPRPLQTPRLIKQMADMLDKSGLTLSDLLADLPGIREEIYRERYQGEERIEHG